MKTLSLNFWGQTKYWWVVLFVGIALVIGGFAYWFWPAAGFAVASQIFGWLLILAGVVQLCVSAGVNRPRGWGHYADMHDQELYGLVASVRASLT